MNGINLLVFLIFLLTRNLILSFIALLLDLLGVKVSVDLLKESDDKKSAVIGLILFLFALLGAAGLSVLAVMILVLGLKIYLWIYNYANEKKENLEKRRANE